MEQEGTLLSILPPLHCLGKSSGPVMEGWESFLWKLGSILIILMSQPVGTALLPGFWTKHHSLIADPFFIQTLQVLHSTSSELSSCEKTFLWCCSWFKYIICEFTVNSHLLNEASYKLEIFPQSINLFESFILIKTPQFQAAVVTF